MLSIFYSLIFTWSLTFTPMQPELVMKLTKEMSLYFHISPGWATGFKKTKNVEWLCEKSKMVWIIADQKLNKIPDTELRIEYPSWYSTTFIAPSLFTVNFYVDRNTLLFPPRYLWRDVCLQGSHCPVFWPTSLWHDSYCLTSFSTVLVTLIITHQEHTHTST